MPPLKTRLLRNNCASTSDSIWAKKKKVLNQKWTRWRHVVQKQWVVIRWMQWDKKLAECITVASNWEHGHMGVQQHSCLMRCTGYPTYSQLQYHAELIMCKKVWLPSLAWEEDIQCITHHSEYFQFFQFFNWLWNMMRWNRSWEAACCRDLKHRTSYGAGDS